MPEKSVHRGYVITDRGEVYVQLPADNERGFVVADDDQQWQVPPCAWWEPVAADDPRVGAADRERLGWLLDSDEE